LDIIAKTMTTTSSSPIPPLTWKNALTDPPLPTQKLLVVDSWNIEEGDDEAIQDDEGSDNQTFLSLRVVWFDHETERWMHVHSDQRVRFEWYVPITVPEPLLERGFALTYYGCIQK
jgi:hypothetical protein